MILAGDIGGTKTNLGLFESNGQGLVEIASERYDSHAFPGLSLIVEDFLQKTDRKIQRAGFGVAGPVIRGRAEATNLSWVVDLSELKKELGTDQVVLVNDLVATAAGLMDLPPEKLHSLYEGKPYGRGTRSVIAPGTGLGEAALIWDGVTYHPLPSEGGHADFAPRTETEIALLQYLLKKQDRVSYEDVISGPGLSRIYDFLRDTQLYDEPDWLSQEIQSARDRNQAISKAGLEKRAEIAVRCLDLWAAILGAEAGNLALRALSIGGVFLGGGIVIQLMEKLREPPFVEAYVAKGALGDLVRKIPVRVVLDDRAALFGAARLASDLEQHSPA